MSSSVVITILIICFLIWLIKQNNKKQINCGRSSHDNITNKFFDSLANEIMLIRHKLAIIEMNQGKHELDYLSPDFIVHRLMSKPYDKKFAWGFTAIEGNGNQTTEFLDVCFLIGGITSIDWGSDRDHYSAQQLIDNYSEPKDLIPLKKGMDVDIVLHNRNRSNPDGFTLVTSTILSVNDREITLELNIRTEAVIRLEMDISSDELNNSDSTSDDQKLNKIIRTVYLLSGENLFTE
ncbi:TPA: hypothetical protein ACF74P_000702 [Legionella pneumophila]|uniref:hypothetical protein n=1 Tax=Legionella pneumophila TaxID=446 RepID=UPI00047F9A71|nr:hypothetical protein [Legionella pneumophila]MDW8866133.1 hypothetical protein [Legionella pneumophila]MDW9173081.1 hypothetical protein [Legionella pneumophila]SNV06537.1 Uncharacterised protein [Legionella pneumophila]HAT4426825.1 hypothetical protein [Legionella pneumophila]HAT8692248.1 hypothetical protein [Legionella pneumophila]